MAITQREKYQHALLISDLFKNFPRSYINTPTTKLDKIFNKHRHKQSIGSRLFSEFLILIYRDVINNNAWFKYKYTCGRRQLLQLSLNKITDFGENFKTNRELGWQYVDTYQVLLTKGTFTYTVYCNPRLKKEFYTNMINESYNNKPYKKTTLKTYLEVLLDNYPELDPADIRRSVKYGLNQFSKALENHPHVIVRRELLKLFIGSVANVDNKITLLDSKNEYLRKKRIFSNHYIYISKDMYEDIVNNKKQSVFLDNPVIIKDINEVKKVWGYWLEVEYESESKLWKKTGLAQEYNIIRPFVTSDIKYKTPNHEKIHE